MSENCWYNMALSYEILDYSGQDDWEDCIAMTFFDPTAIDDGERFVLRFTDADLLSRYAEAFERAAEAMWLVEEVGADAAMTHLGMDRMPNMDDITDISDLFGE